jgi:hypothetical protein
MTCEHCQQECYDLLDYNLSPAAERAVMEHIASCEVCRDFLEAEQIRMRQWPRLFNTAVVDLRMPADVVERVAHAMEISRHIQSLRFITATRALLTEQHVSWRILVASFAVLIGIIALFQTGISRHQREMAKRSRAAYAETREDNSLTLLSQNNAAGVELPPDAAGVVRLTSGEMCIRLGSGVELSLVGPVELMVENTMKVWLERGSLLAHVPSQAVGFQVQTATLDIWDMGTIFSVSVKEGSSSVFVFQGSVQVNEASGDAVDACLAGQGVCERAGYAAFKVAADFDETEQDFKKVAGRRALKSIVHSLAVAERVGTRWMEHYLPKTEEQRRAYFAREAARHLALSRPAFSKQAWVRPSAPLTPLTKAKRLSPLQQEESMNTKTAVAAMAASATLLGAGISGATSAPIQVDTAPRNNRHWMTVFTNEVPLRWNWPDAATSATLEIVGMNTVFTTNFTQSASNWLWRPFTGTMPQAEDLCDLTLTFHDSDSAVVGALTSRLAILKAAFGPTAVDTASPEKNWTTVKENLVLPYDGSWAAATADATASQLVIAKTDGSMTQTNTLADASGYVGWKNRNSDWGFGTFDLTLTFPGTVEEGWAATLTRLADGTVIIVF